MDKQASDFFQRVYDLVKQVPFGRVTSYGAIARYLGATRGARMVGWAMNNVPDREEVPAHRVVNRVGLLTGKHHFGGTNLMQQLLENEGLVIVDDKIQEFAKHFWDPLKELGEPD